MCQDSCRSSLILSQRFPLFGDTSDTQDYNSKFFFLFTGVYGTAVHLPGFSELTIGSGMSQNSSTLCVFSESSELYPENVRNVFQLIEEFVPRCDDLDEYWTFLVSIMSLSFIGLLVSIVGILTNCITPCVEDQYEQVWRPKTPDV